MRMLLTAQMDTDKGSKAIQQNRLAEIMKSALGQLEPEAAYFGALEGDRTAYIVFDLKKVSDIPQICEPLFGELGAKVSLVPVMSFEDVQEGVSRVGKG